jgi:hypothetical protein
MDPVVIGVVVIFLILLALKIFFGLAKFVLRLGVIIVIAVIIWRVFIMKA